MTRINSIPVYELSDPQLVAEYRELPRAIKMKVNTKDAPQRYCLGQGHVKWAKKHSIYLFKRYKDLIEEMKFRGFTPNYTMEDLLKRFPPLPENSNDYIPDDRDMHINRERIMQKYSIRPHFYKWTKREKPNYLKG